MGRNDQSITMLALGVSTQKVQTNGFLQMSPTPLNLSCMKKIKISYDTFIRNGLTIGFTDDQIDFLWDMFAEVKPDPNDFEEIKVSGGSQIN